MTVQIKQWLNQQLAAVDSVRSVKTSADYLAVYTWSGVVIHVYLVAEPIRARAIKRIVNDNTRVGVGTLFIIDVELVPEDGTHVEPDEGLFALHALFQDKLYTYDVRDGVPVIGQVHFKAFNRSDVREIWYGPDVPIRNLPSYRVWITAPQSIKGNWLVANFGSEAFWKTADYTLERDVLRQRKRRAQGNPRFFQWSNPVWNTNPGGEGYATPANPPPETQLERSYRQLGISRNASSDDVKAAFRRLAREVHPDVSNLPKDEAEARFKVLYDAYAFIKASNGW